MGEKVKRVVKLTTKSRAYLLGIIKEYIRWNHGTAMIQVNKEYYFAPPMEDLLRRFGMLKEMQVRK